MRGCLIGIFVTALLVSATASSGNSRAYGDQAKSPAPQATPGARYARSCRAPLCRLSRRSQKPPRLAGTPAKAWETMTAMAEATLPDLIATGFVKAPLELERTYKGVRLTASVQPDGTVLCGGRDCETLSAAGGVARKSVLATPPSDPPPETNGWTFWQFRDPRPATCGTWMACARSFWPRRSDVFPWRRHACKPYFFSVTVIAGDSCGLSVCFVNSPTGSAVDVDRT